MCFSATGVEGMLNTRGSTMNVAGAWHFSTAAGGWGLRVSTQSVIEGMGDYALDSLFGFDSDTGTASRQIFWFFSPV